MPENYQPRMTVTSGTVLSASAKRAWSVIQFGLALFILIYVALAITLVRVIPGVPGGVGFELSKNASYYGGIIPVSSNEEKEEVIIDRSEYHDNSVWDRTKISFKPNGNTAKVKVVAGPTGKLEWNAPDIITVNGHQVEGYMEPVEKTDRNPDGNPINGTQYLYEQYLGVCESGACNEGEIIVFKKGQVIGVPVM